MHSDPVANLHRMRTLAGYDLFDPDLATDLRTVCRQTAERLGVAVAAVQVVLDTATAVIATNGGDTDFLTLIGGGPNELSLCPNVVITRAPYIIDDLTAHTLHASNPAVQAGLLRSYAGVPLTLDGEIIGSHCVMDPEPRQFSEADITELTTAATAIVAHITERRLVDHV